MKLTWVPKRRIWVSRCLIADCQILRWLCWHQSYDGRHLKGAHWSIQPLRLSNIWNKLKNRRTVNTKTRQLGEASSSSMLSLLCPDQREQEIWGWCIHIQHHELAISIGISTAFLPGDKFLENSEDEDWPHNTLHTLQPSHAQNMWNSASTSCCTVWGIEKFQRYRAFPTKLCARKRLRSDSMAVR